MGLTMELWRKNRDVLIPCLFKMRMVNTSGSAGMKRLNQPQNDSLASLFLMHSCPLFVQGPHHILISPFLLGLLRVFKCFLARAPGRQSLTLVPASCQLFLAGIKDHMTCPGAWSRAVGLPVDFGRHRHLAVLLAG